jgi:hypothetical protein
MRIDATELIRILEESGYFQNYLTFGDANVRNWDWERTGRFLSGKSKLLWEALLCGKEVSRAQLEKAISKQLVSAFLERGLCSGSQGKVKFGFNSLINAGGFSFFINRASLAEGYFGEDSRILLSLRPHFSKGRALCLYSGTGAEVIGFAPADGIEADIEADPSIHPYINTNLELNAFAGRARVISPDSRSEGPYDVIVARVPSAVEFGGISFPVLMAGGPDGNGKWEPLLRRAQEALTDQGRLVFIGVFYGSKESNLASRQLKALFDAQGLTACINIGAKLAMELGIPLFNQILSTAEVCTKRPRTELLTLLDKELESSGCSHAYLVKGMAWKSRRGAPGSILDLTEQYYGTWLT